MTRRATPLLAPLAPLALVAALGGCRSAKPEAAALVASVEMFHRAGNLERPDRADAISRVECQNQEVCEAKATCVEATMSTAEALRLKGEAEAILAAVEAGKTPPDDPVMKTLPDKLDRASRLLAKGHEGMPPCDHKILVLRERYGL